MKRYNSHRNGAAHFVSSMVRAAWYALTALLISPVYAGFDQMPDWLVLLPLISIVTVLAGIVGFDPLHVAAANDEHDSMVAGAH